MSAQQFSILLKALAAHHPYTIAGADDYPVLMACLGLLVGLGIYIWQDLKHTIKEHRQEWRTEIESEIAERKEQDSFIWKALREHKEDCTKEREKQEI